MNASAEKVNMVRIILEFEAQFPTNQHPWAKQAKCFWTHPMHPDQACGFCPTNGWTSTGHMLHHMIVTHPGVNAQFLAQWMMAPEEQREEIGEGLRGLLLMIG